MGLPVPKVIASCRNIFVQISVRGYVKTTIKKASRWALWLPILSAVVTTLLLVLAPLQDEAFYHANSGSRGYVAYHYAPAWTIATTANGPFFLLGGLFGVVFGQSFEPFGRVLAVVVFWFFVGWTIDRRSRGGTPPVITSPKLNVFVQLVLFGASLLALLSTLVFSSTKLSFDFMNLGTSLRLWGIRSPVFAAGGMMLWSVALTVFFARRVVLAARLLR